MTAKRFIQVINGVKDTRTGRVLTHPLEITLKLNEINDLYDYVFNRNEGLEKENEQLKEENKVFDKKLTKYIVNYNGLNCEYNWLNTENEQIKKDLKIILPLLLAIDFKISINECKAINRLCKLVEDDFIKSKELHKVVEKKEYPKRKPITYESVPEAIYNWDDKND